MTGLVNKDDGITKIFNKILNKIFNFLIRLGS